MALPTRNEMLANATAELDKAYDALCAAADWLRSDWQPVGCPLTDTQADARKNMSKAIVNAKRAINQATDRL